jgi:hypothetical protein
MHLYGQLKKKSLPLINVHCVNIARLSAERKKAPPQNATRPLRNSAVGKSIIPSGADPVRGACSTGKDFCRDSVICHALPPGRGGIWCSPAEQLVGPDRTGRVVGRPAAARLAGDDARRHGPIGAEAGIGGDLSELAVAAEPQPLSPPESPEFAAITAAPRSVELLALRRQNLGRG